MTPKTVNVISTTVVAGATVALAGLTAWYARATSRMLAEMRESREPCVLVDLEVPAGHDMRLVVSNTGQSVARNVRFTVRRDVEWIRGWKGENTGIASLPIMRNGISYLAPGRSLKFSAGSFLPTRAEEIHGALEMQVRYETESGKKVSRDVVIETNLYSAVRFDSYRDSGWQIAEELRSLQRRMDSDRALQRSPFRLVGKRVCPNCGEHIAKAAKKCHFCLEFLPEPEGPAPGSQAPPPEAAK